jgi:ATP-binding cassette subfamily B protein
MFPVEELSSFEVKNLGFTYSGEDGFKDVSFVVQPGKMIAIAGGMASGKSTLLSVLMGLMPPDSGDMYWNREPLNSLSDRTQKRIAGTPQRGGFFADDIMTNLCLEIEAGDLSIAEALKIAALDDIVYGSDEWLTKNIGDHGDKLSGGQRQRLALARTIIRGAEISIFDDCISALDEETRKDVLYRLTDYLLKNRRSAIIATNSRPFLESADTVIFMSDGRIEATGSFDELMQSCVAFSAVVSQT